MTPPTRSRDAAAHLQDVRARAATVRLARAKRTPTPYDEPIDIAAEILHKGKSVSAVLSMIAEKAGVPDRQVSRRS